ncbi:SDR family NAD(P)-dependent oxidoreductase [Paracoccus sp. p4-l81]|uniref:SDR family NAD(P)-dependent oxidoreductase n=1 Tax=Paracoccus sp. p4-l81 TaxID=3342806 RepID=UPI0035B77130
MPDAPAIWIMGASDGIGAAVARAYAARGARLILSARSPGPLAALAAELGATALPCDTADAEGLAQVAAQVGPIDRAITLAALYDPGAAMQADPARAAQIVTTNLTGSLLFAQAAVPLLRPGGQLALTGSVAGYVGLPQGQIYSATKAGVINLAETLRAELWPRVDVRLICPGFVATRMTARNDFDMPGLMTPKPPQTASSRVWTGAGSRSTFPAA